MLIIKNTANSLGVSIAGDYNDFEQLYNALHNIVGEEEYGNYEGSRLRVLGLCHDIRHAMQGDREYEMVSNGIDEEIMKFNSRIMPINNVYLKINSFWPEILYIQMVLNDFVTLYIQEQGGFKRSSSFREIWDRNISTVRNLQASVNECIKETIPKAKYNRIIYNMTSIHNSFRGYATQYLDELNLKFINMSPQKRKDNISIMAKRLFEQGEEYKRLKKDLIMASKKHDCSVLQLMIDLNYPEEVKW
ncbi:MAG: hypothetical protein LR001_04955 [Clostridiales bacterium]|nr:hypothetical protein [Clostridiales bacterium]